MSATPEPKLRVYLIDDHPVVRKGFARALGDEPDFEIVGQAATALEGLGGAGDASPDVVLVDLALPDLDGVELIAALRATLPDVKLVVVSAYDDEYRVAEALRAGANGYLLKTSTVAELVEGIRLAITGGTPLTPRLAEGVMRAMRRPIKQTSGTLETLTPRELQVLRLFATGLPTRDIAQRLGISPKTIETHRIRICEKLGARTVVDLTRIAVRVGLIDA